MTIHNPRRAATSLRLLATLALCILLAGTGCRKHDPPPLDLSADTSHAEARDLVTVLQQTNRHDSLLETLARAQLSDRLRHEGPLTVFAPTDDAFRRSGMRLDTVDSADTLRHILSLHLARGRYDASSVAGSLRIASVAGVPLTLRQIERRLLVERLSVRETHVALNGIVHVIDSVILPPAPDTSGRDPLRKRRQATQQP